MFDISSLIGNLTSMFGGNSGGGPIVGTPKTPESPIIQSGGGINPSSQKPSLTGNILGSEEEKKKAIDDLMKQLMPYKYGDKKSSALSMLSSPQSQVVSGNISALMELLKQKG